MNSPRCLTTTQQISNLEVHFIQINTRPTQAKTIEQASHKAFEIPTLFFLIFEPRFYDLYISSVADFGRLENTLEKPLERSQKLRSLFPPKPNGSIILLVADRPGGSPPVVLLHLFARSFSNGFS